MPAKTIIQLRRDTAANWTSEDPVLAAGEIGIETNTNRLKVGNGSTSWNGLSYFINPDHFITAGGGLTTIPTPPSETEPSENFLVVDTDVIATKDYVDTALEDKAPATQPVSDKSGNYTLQASDANSLVRSTGSAITVTVPDILQNGERIDFIQAGAGQITFAGSGLTLNSADAKLKTAKQYSGATIFKAGGAYYLVGNLG